MWDFFCDKVWLSLLECSFVPAGSADPSSLSPSVIFSSSSAEPAGHEPKSVSSKLRLLFSHSWSCLVRRRAPVKFPSSNLKEEEVYF